MAVRFVVLRIKKEIPNCLFIMKNKTTIFFTVFIFLCISTITGQVGINMAATPNAALEIKSKGTTTANAFLIKDSNNDTLMTVKDNGSMSIGNSKPDASAQLDVSSSNKGLLLPKMDETQRNNISNSVPGLIIYNTTASCLQMYDGNKWMNIICKGGGTP